MLWEFIFLNILVISLGSLTYVLIRALPRLDERPVKRGVIERWLLSDLPVKLDAFFRTAYLRTLRRVKVFVLKADNSINQKLESIKLERGSISGNEKVDLGAMKEKVAEIGEETGVE